MIISIEQQNAINDRLEKLKSLGITGRIDFHFKTTEFFAQIHTTQFFTSVPEELIRKVDKIIETIHKEKWRSYIPEVELSRLEDILLEMKKLPRPDFSNETVKRKWIFIALDNHTSFSLGQYTENEVQAAKTNLLDYVKAWYVLKGVDGNSGSYDSLAVSSSGKMDMFHFSNRPWVSMVGPLTEYIHNLSV